MTTLIQAHKEWMSRPADERFPSVQALHDKALGYQENAVAAQNVSTHDLKMVESDGDVYLKSKNDIHPVSNWSFNQLAIKGGAPAGYLSSLPAEIAVDCLNHGLENSKDRDNLLLFAKGETVENGISKEIAKLRALTSMRYGRIWNSDITRRLVDLESQGTWNPAPAAADGSRGLYLGDRDMFAFMVDNERRVYESAPGGGLSRGFFIRNSEVGAASFSISTFYYNFICGNHMVWGASDIKEVKIRHIGDANGRAFDDLEAELIKYAESSASEAELQIERSIKHKIGNDLDEILDTVMGLRINGLTKKVIKEGHALAEQRVDWYGDPNTVWGLAGGLTEIARDLPNADDRVALETATGKMMEIAF